MLMSGVKQDVIATKVSLSLGLEITELPTQFFGLLRPAAHEQEVG